MHEGNSRRSRTIRILALSLCLAGAAAQAMPVKWRSSNFRYVVDGKPLKDVLRDFGASQGMVVTVGADVEGTVVGKFDLTPRQFIDLLSLSYGFVYYYNGAVLHFSASQGMRSTLIRLNAARVQSLRETLDRLGISETRFPIVYDEEANTALVAGPQEYVDVIREVSVQLEKRTQAGGRSVTRVFALRSTWAADRKTAQGEIQPGLASVLQALYGPVAAGSAASGSASRDEANAMIGLAGPGQAIAPELGAAQSEKAVDTGSLSLRKALNLDARPSATAPPAAIRQGGRSTTFMATPTLGRSSPADVGGAPDSDRRQDENLPVILADAAGNNLIVRDLPERMPAYQALIASLDIQPRMIEIAVQILDISENALTDVGVDWNLRGSRLDARSGAALPSAAGGVMTAVLGNSGRALLARIAALEKTGQARVSSRPKVATLNNVAAVMSSEKTFYVKVPGYQSSSLFNVTAGLDMKVTPMATFGPQGYRIRLDVQVQDGQISTTESVGDLPTVTRSQIGTQAVVRQDESLLLAGYAVERAGKTQGGIPLLADLPVIGSIFRQRTTETSRVERLFLVTPRVLD
ncbi:EscC/YscC/HrcC family type III secretion system outer membrane ring protein [Xylophilus sp. Kf1]|nr:EscC/YscC/HrcC family type III secretion system outer membrane ring protein [Xylophilus sp. Kf1]